MKKFNILIRTVGHNTFLIEGYPMQTGNVSEQLAFVEDNIDQTGTFFCGRKDKLIALDKIINFEFKEIK